jgi:hypothetical protein
MEPESELVDEALRDQVARQLSAADQEQVSLDPLRLKSLLDA